MIDPRDLPYAANGGFAPKPFRVLCYIATALIALGKFTGYLPSYWLAAVPLVLLGGLYLVHHMVRAAVHEAVRLADSDYELDQQVEKSLVEEAKRTLTPNTMIAKMKGYDS